MVCTDLGETSSEEHAETLYDGTPVESPATTDTIKSEDTDECGECVGDVVQSRDPLGGFVRDTGNTENGRGVDGDTGNTDPFLEDLEPDDELNTTSCVELARANTEEHADVRVRAGRLTLKLGDVADILKFGFGLAHVGAGLATKTTQDVAGFFFTANLGEPTWRLGEEPDNAEEDKKRQDLEGNGESPDELVVA